MCSPVPLIVALLLAADEPKPENPPAAVQKALDGYLKAVAARDLDAMAERAGVPWLDRDRQVVRKRAGLRKALQRVAAQLPKDRGKRKVEAFTWKTLRARVEALGHGNTAVTTAKVAAVGPATEAALRDWGIVPDLVPGAATTAALGQAFPPRTGGSPATGAVLLARADLANPELAVALRDKGWATAEVVAYHTVPVGTLDPSARRRLDHGEVDWVAFTASSTVEGFLRGYGGPPPAGVRVAAIEHAVAP